METVSIPDKYLQGLQKKIKKALFTTAEKKTIDGQKVFVVSDETVDREGETISVDGWQLDNYKNYPVLLWAHNAAEPLIGHGTNLRYKTINGKKKLTFIPKFHRKDERSRLLSDLVDEDWVRGVSVGFLPMEQEDDRYTKQELLEISLVNVPSNPNALQAVYAKGHSKDLVSKILKKIRFWKYHICKKCGFSRETREGATYRTMDCPSCGKALTKSMKDIKPVTLKPYPNEHACRLKDPAGFQDGSFRRVSRKHDGKEYDVIMGRLEDKKTMAEQAYRYPKKTWEAGEARSHCKAHNGISFEAASKSIKELKEEAEKKMKKIELKKTNKKEEKKKALSEKKAKLKEKRIKLQKDRVNKIIKKVKKGLEGELTTLIGGIEKNQEEMKAENKKFKSRVARRMKDVSREMQTMAGIVGKMAKKTDKFIEGIEKRDEVIELNNKKVNKEFKKIKLDIEKGIDSSKLDTKLDDIEENIQSLAKGLKSFTSARESGSKQSGDDAKRRNRQIALRALNKITEVLNKEKENG